MILALTPALIYGQQEGEDTSYEGKRIEQILFDPVAQPFPQPELDKYLTLKVGSVYHEKDIRESIQNLFSSGRFADIAVDGTQTTSGITLKFLTKRTYFVGQVNIDGVSEPPNRGQLAGVTNLQLGAEYSDADGKRAAEAIRNLLIRNGFYHATVDYKARYDHETEQVDLDFNVTTEDRAKFEKPLITGTPQRSTSSIVRSTRWRRLYGLLGWQSVTESRVQSGIDNVRQGYQKKDMLLAKVHLKSLDYNEKTNRVKPSLDIIAGPKIQIRVRGARIRKGRLKQLVPIYQERTVDRDLLQEGARNISQALQAEGYFDAQVTFRETPAKNKQQMITYFVNRGTRHKIVAVEINGNHYFDERTLRERMYVLPATRLRFRHGRFSQQLLEQDVRSIKDLYRSNGFRDATVDSQVEDSYEGKSNQEAVIININEGPQTFVSNIGIQGPSPEDTKYIQSILLSAQGQPYSDLNIATDRDNILSYFYNKGYFNATFNYSVTPTDQSNRVNVHFNVLPGKRKFVRSVLVSGLETTRSDLVQEKIQLAAGDPLSLAQMTESQRRLYALGVFARVDTAVQNPGANEDSKYVLYRVEEAHRYSFNVGFGAQLGRIGSGPITIDTPAGTTGFSPRATLGISRNNFLGLGHTISLQTRFSSFQKRGVLSYTAPQFKGNENLSLTFSSLFDDSNDVRTFSARRIEGSTQLTQKLSRANSFQYRVVFRRVSQSDLKIDPLLVPLFSQPIRVGLFGISFIQDRRDDPTDAHRGVYNTIDLSYATKALGSQIDFGRFLFRNASYHRLSRDWVFARSFTFGGIFAGGDSKDFPLPERFFSGGGTSIRAFPENQAGPRDLLTGFPIGGNSVLFNTLELRFPLIGDNLGGVLFHDAGNVYSDLNHISFRFRQRDFQDFNYMVQSVGFGIRYRTPIGPVRVDLSFSPNSPRFFGCKGTLDELVNNCNSAEGSITRVAQRINQFQFHFSLGQSF